MATAALPASAPQPCSATELRSAYVRSDRTTRSGCASRSRGCRLAACIRRFFHPVNELTADDLRRLTEIDFRDHVAIVLTVGAGSDERLIAVGRYVRVVSGGDLAEVAFTVVDDYQHRGAATLLLRELVAIAREHGVRKFVALVLDDNRQMLEVFRRSKLPMRESFVDGVRRVVLTLDVAAPAKVRRRPRSLRPPQRNPDAMATIL